MKNILILLVLSLSNFIQAQSPYNGTWTWENGNEKFYVYILSKTLDSGDKVLRVDYKMTKTVNGMTTEVYSSKYQGQFYWFGAVLSEEDSISSGSIYDFTHPETTDGIQGSFILSLISPNQIHWEIMHFSDYTQPASTNNPPDDFNLPKDIILTKVQ